jgi:4-alpha-glucanotransferase
MAQLQDLLRLGDDARMNKPGIAEGNWAWQADETLMVEYERAIAGVIAESGRHSVDSATSA